MNTIPGKPKTLMAESFLPNGCTLYWCDNDAGGRTYYSDEVGGGVVIWDTSLVDGATLLAAMAMEAALLYREAEEEQQGRKFDTVMGIVPK